MIGKNKAFWWITKMKKLLYLIPFLIIGNLWADSTTGGSVGFIKISTGVQDTQRHWGDKLNQNWDIAAATISTALTRINNLATATTTISNSMLTLVVSSNVKDGTLTGNDMESNITIGSFVATGTITASSMTLFGTLTTTSSVIADIAQVRQISFRDGTIMTTVGDSVKRPFSLIVGTAASQSVDYFGASQIPWIQASTTLAAIGGGKVIGREGTYTFTAGATVPWNVTWEGQGGGRGRGASIITTNGNFNALTVSGTVSGFEFNSPSGYAGNFFVLKSSAELSGNVLRNISIGNSATFLANAFIRPETRSMNVSIKNNIITGFSFDGSGVGVGIIQSSMSDSLFIDGNYFNSFVSNNAAIFGFSGGQKFITNNHIEITGGKIMNYHGQSSGTLISGNQFLFNAFPEVGFAQVGISGIGHAEGWRIVNNVFRQRTTGGGNIFDIQGDAGSQAKGWLFHGNYFIGMSNTINCNATNCIGAMIHGNVFSHSSSVTDGGTGTRIRDNVTMDGTVNPAEN